MRRIHSQAKPLAPSDGAHGSRRRFLQTLGLGFGVGGLHEFSFAQRVAGVASPRPVIFVFLRGGADGLALLSPLDDPDFLAARPPEMRFEKSMQAADAPITEWAGTRFYWHPHLAPLAEFYHARQLQIWQAVGLTNETRSHFEAQEIMERGLSDLQQRPDEFGFITRLVRGANSSHAANTNQSLAHRVESIPFFAATPALPRAFLGSAQTLAVRDLQAGITVPGGALGLAALQALVTSDRQSVLPTTLSELWSTIDFLNAKLPQRDGKVVPYTSAASTAYPNSDLGIGLRSVARLLEADVGLRFAWIDSGGWDTHEGQVGRLNNLVKDFSGSLEAFAQDQKARQRSYTVVILTEFGRRLSSNRSQGTDHGHGSLAWILSDGLLPTQPTLMGAWPGLTPAALSRGVDLAVTTDYRTVLGAALTQSATP